MTYATSKDAIGKKDLQVCGLVMDKCTLVAGVAPCTATETGDDKCYNTRATCNDIPNYTLGTVEVKFSQPRSNLPVGEFMFPAISGKVTRSPTSVTAGKGLGNRAVISVKIKDFPHHDRGIDPYYAERTYDAETTGTFWPRYLKRNPYFEGRTLKLYSGYINEPFNWDDFEIEEYDITDISGPNKGEITITAKDILIRTYSTKTQYPEISSGKLLADITAGASSATLTPTGIGSSYPASGTVSMGKEAITFTRSGDVLTLTGRAQWGTEAKEHKAGDVVQICVVWEQINVVDVLYELCVTAAGILAANVPYNDDPLNPDLWDIEKEIWLSTSLVTGILMKPESIDKVIGELSEQFMIDIWNDAVQQYIMIKAMTPELAGVTINTFTEGYNILRDSLKIQRNSKDRASEVQVWFNKIDYSERDDIDQFSKASIKVDPSRSSSEKYGSRAVKVILSRWITDEAQASQLSGRLFARFADTPESIEFEVAAKDSDLFAMAGRLDVDSWQFQGFSGANETRRFQVTEIKPDSDGHSLKVKALTSYFVGRYGFIAPDGTPDYSSATEEQQESYAFICLDTGLFADGTEGYKII